MLILKDTNGFVFESHKYYGDDKTRKTNSESDDILKVYFRKTKDLNNRIYLYLPEGFYKDNIDIAHIVFDNKKYTSNTNIPYLEFDNIDIELYSGIKLLFWCKTLLHILNYNIKLGKYNEQLSLDTESIESYKEIELNQHIDLAYEGKYFLDTDFDFTISKDELKLAFKTSDNIDSFFSDLPLSESVLLWQSDVKHYNWLDNFSKHIFSKYKDLPIEGYICDLCYDQYENVKFANIEEI